MADYTLLHNEDSEFKNNSNSQPPQLSVGSRTSGFDIGKLLMWTSFMLVIFTSVANLWLLNQPSRATSNIDYTMLPHIDSYVGLEDLKINRTYEMGLRIDLFPSVMTQISSLDPQRIWPDDPVQFMNKYIGTVSPDSRRFQIEPSISTVAQFRTIDFGMENCHLQLNLQSLEIKDMARWGWPTSFISVWTLEKQTHKLDIRKLSWSTRPRRVEQIASWKVTTNELLTSGTFSCPWGSYPTFEFACETTGCLVDFWNNPRFDSPALNLVQTSSLIDEP